MAHVRVTERVDAPVATVWAVATDIEASPQAISGIERVELLTDRPFDVGTRWRETRRMFGREATEEMWVTAVEVEHSYTVEAESRGMHYVSQFEFVPVGDGTEVRLTFGGTATTPLTKAMNVVTGRLMVSAVRRALAADLADLQVAAERRAAT